MLEKMKNIVKAFFLPKANNVDYSIWIFSSSFNTKYNYNSKYLFEYVKRNYPDIQPRYVINDNQLRKKLQEKHGKEYFIETNTIEGMKKVLHAGVWLTSAGLPIYGLNLNKDRLIINLWHGVPLKKIALMEENTNTITKLYFKYFFSKNYTYILTTSHRLNSIMAESFGVSQEKIKVWGQPRNDVILKKQNKENVLSELYKELPEYKKIILYAPTFRDEYNTEFFPFEDFQENELNEYLEENKLLIFIRSHQSETGSFKFHSTNRIKLINEDKVEDIAEVINIFDLLITDYSSIYIDYLLTEKPVLFLPYDQDQYLKNRGLNFDYNEVTPGPKPNTFVNFKQELIKLLNNNKYYKVERQKANNFFNEIKEPSSEKIIKKIKNKRYNN